MEGLLGFMPQRLRFAQDLLSIGDIDKEPDITATGELEPGVTLRVRLGAEE